MKFKQDRQLKVCSNSSRDLSVLSIILVTCYYLFAVIWASADRSFIVWSAFYNLFVVCFSYVSKVFSTSSAYFKSSTFFSCFLLSSMLSLLNWEIFDLCWLFWSVKFVISESFSCLSFSMFSCKSWFLIWNSLSYLWANSNN